MLHVIHAMQLQTTFIIFPSYKTDFLTLPQFLFSAHSFSSSPLQNSTHTPMRRRTQTFAFYPIFANYKNEATSDASTLAQHSTPCTAHAPSPPKPFDKTPASWNNFKAESQTTGDCDSSMTWSVTRACAKKIGMAGLLQTMPIVQGGSPFTRQAPPGVIPPEPLFPTRGRTLSSFLF